MQLRAEGVSRSYGGLDVLREVSLDVGAGEIVAVIGPSGCGKSTLLRLLGGLERPDAGRVLIAGAPPAGSLAPLAYVFQDFALAPWRDAAANVSLPLEHLPMPRAERESRVAAALGRVGLADFAHALPRQLSGGMKQRVAIARALVVEPAIFLMDEPLSALDAQTRELLLDDLIGLWRERRFAAVYVTHNLAEATRLGHRVVVLSRRPGAVRETVTIDAPIEERREGHPDIVAANARLWALIRNEAAAADRELVDG